jgi:hypothetical protein
LAQSCVNKATSAIRFCLSSNIQQVGEHEFVSRPDATVEARTKINFVGPTFIVVEDKPDPDPLGDLNAETELDEPGVKSSNKQHYKQKWNIESKVANKEDTPTLAKFQLAGEMLAAAVRNYEVYRMPQTVFALRVIGVYFHFFALTYSHFL